MPRWEGPLVSCYTRINDYRIHYLKAGKGEPVLLLHGIPASSVIWQKVMPVLVNECQAFAPDLLGYGESEKPQFADVSISAQAELMLAFLSEITEGPVTVIGHGIGGGVAQVLAVRHPERVNGMVLMDTVCYDAWPAIMRGFMKPRLEKTLTVNRLEEMLRKELLEGVVQKDRFASNGAMEGMAQTWSSPWGVGAFLQNVQALNSRDTQAVAASLRNLEIPVLILWGREDPWLKPGLAERLRADIPKSWVEIFPQAGHYIMEDEPERTAAKILEFLRSTRGARVPERELVTV